MYRYLFDYLGMYLMYNMFNVNIYMHAVFIWDINLFIMSQLRSYEN